MYGILKTRRSFEIFLLGKEKKNVLMSQRSKAGLLGCVEFLSEVCCHEFKVRCSAQSRQIVWLSRLEA